MKFGPDIGRIAVSEYRRFVMNPRMILLVVAILIIRTMVILPVTEAADSMGEVINIVEMPIAIVSSWISILLIVISYVVLMSSFPSVDDNMQLYITRTSKKRWIIGEFIFQIVSAFSYTAVIALVGIISGAKRAYVLNGWSLVVTAYDDLMGDKSFIKMSEYIPGSLCNQMTPYKAFVYSYFLLFLFLVFCNLLFLLGCMYSRRLLFFFIQTAHVAIGCAIMQIDVKGKSISWLFPITHAMLLKHYNNYFRKYIFPPWLSVVILGVACIIMFVIIYRKSSKVSLDMIGGTVFS